MAEPMDITLLPKAVREGYEPSPFFFWQEHEPGKGRWVVWTSSLADLKSLLYGVLEAFPETVDVLVKVKQRAADGERPDDWQRYHATCELAQVVEAIQCNEVFAFQDGASQLCVMCGGGGDYLALDDHGIFFLYADNPGCAKLFERFGFEHRTEELLTDAGHWHGGSSSADEQRARFISQLELKPI